MQGEAPDARELQRVVNGVEAGFLDALETVDGFRGKADQLNSYLFFTGTPDYFEEDLARFRALAPRDLCALMAFHTESEHKQGRYIATSNDAAGVAHMIGKEAVDVTKVILEEHMKVRA